MMSYLKKVWRGDEKLWITFLLIETLGGLFIVLPIMLAFALKKFMALAFVVGIICAVGLGIFVTVSSWRSASKFKGLSFYKRLVQFYCIFRWLGW